MARPAQFERNDVLQKAMEVFWDHGYNATGMADLVAATSLKSGSLYAAFHSKQDLFLEVLDHYGARTAAKLEQTLAEAASPLEGIRRYFLGLADDVAGLRDKPSCLLVNTALELSRQNETIQKRVNRHFDAIEGLFRHALEQAKANGELARDEDPGTLAAFLMCSIWGLRVLAGTSPGTDRIGAVVGRVLEVISGK